MSKRDLYDALKNDGAKLPAYERVNVATLESMYKERFGKEPGNGEGDAGAGGGDKGDRGESIPALHFSRAGWCEKLNSSYFIGWFSPKSWDEYDALKPFADRG